MGNIKLTQVKNEKSLKDNLAEIVPVVKPIEKKQPFKVIEIKEKREKCVKHFRMSDGTYCAEFYTNPVHYFDEISNSFLDITNELFEENGKLVTKHKHFEVEFDNNDSKKLFCLKKNGCSVTLKKHEMVENASLKNTVFNEIKKSDNFMLNNSDTVLLHDFSNNTDLEYKVEDNRLKENIIINEKSECYEFYFELICENLNLSLSDNQHSLEFKNAEGDTLFIIPEPYMYDGNGKTSDEVYYELVPQEEGRFLLTVSASSDWINAEERSFPVTVDPEIDVLADKNLILERQWVDGGLFTQLGNFLAVGVTEDKKIARAYFLADIPTIMNAQVNNAKVSINIYPDFCTVADFCLYNIAEPLHVWTPTFAELLGRESVDCFKQPSNYYFDVDMTDIIRNHFENKNFYGLCVMLSDENQDYNFKPAKVYLQKFTINYSLAENMLAGKYIESFDAGKAGQLGVDLLNGGITAVHSDEIDCGAINIGISHIYNNDAKNLNDKYFGNGWRLNLNQRVENTKHVNGIYENYNSVINYYDENGAIYFLKEKYFYLENNKNIYVTRDQLKKNGANYARDSENNFIYEKDGNEKSVTRAYIDEDKKFILIAGDDRAYYLDEFVKSYSKNVEYKRYYKLGNNVFYLDEPDKVLIKRHYFVKDGVEYECPDDKITTISGEDFLSYLVMISFR